MNVVGTNKIMTSFFFLSMIYFFKEKLCIVPQIALYEACLKDHNKEAIARMLPLYQQSNSVNFIHLATF